MVNLALFFFPSKKYGIPNEHRKVWTIGFIAFKLLNLNSTFCFKNVGVTLNFKQYKENLLGKMEFQATLNFVSLCNSAYFLVFKKK
jgi:hypothetical protein